MPDSVAQIAPEYPDFVGFELVSYDHRSQEWLGSSVIGRVDVEEKVDPAVKDCRGVVKDSRSREVSAEDVD